MRRKTQWAGFGSETGTATLPTPIDVATATPSAILSFNATIAGALGFVDEEVTITRMIGRIFAALNTTSNSADGTYAIGCIVARNEAIAAGIGSLPSPETQPDAEWLYYTVGSLINGANVLKDGPLSAVEFGFDVHAQRVLRAGSSVVWIGHAETSNLTLGVSGRYLAKLT